MAIFKCKMCGGALEIAEGVTVCECDYCCTKQTLPKLSDEKKINLYERAGHFRRSNEFDKAIAVYEKILEEDSTDAEAYWSMVLCRYGIEYVEDPATHKRVPTVNRAQFTSVVADEDYKAAIKYADSVQRDIYESEAKAIDEIQKGILAISQNEEPFDVFICYKETDASGRRTRDSVIANDLYHQLTQEGFKVFFARITLEDKLGTAYEPYIFAALNSAKVMVVLGTSPEYFNAVWVKNEWSRYLALIRKGEKKLLIPAYKDMDPYDLPEEFANLQSQDMSKLGFMQDLIRGIKKITESDKPKEAVRETVVVNNEHSGNASVLIDRGYIALEDNEWGSADDFFEQALNFDAKEPRAYLGKLLAEMRVSKKEQLANLSQPFNNSKNYQKTIRFADSRLAAELNSYIDDIKSRNKVEVYEQATSLMNSATHEEHFRTAGDKFRSVAGYRDAEQLAEDCYSRAEEARKKSVYEKSKNAMNMAGDDAQSYVAAANGFKSLGAYLDAEALAAECLDKADKCRKKVECSKLIAEKEKLEASFAEKKAIFISSGQRLSNAKKYAKLSLIGIAVYFLSLIIINASNNASGLFAFLYVAGLVMQIVFIIKKDRLSLNPNVSTRRKRFWTILLVIFQPFAQVAAIISNVGTLREKPNDVTAKLQTELGQMESRLNEMNTKINELNAQIG